MTLENPTVSTTIVKINSVDISSYCLSWAVNAPRKGIRTAVLTVAFKLIDDNILSFTNGAVLEIWEIDSDDNTIQYKRFYGNIIGITTDLSGYSINASDELWKATGDTIIKLYDINDPLDLFGGDIRLITMDMSQEVGLTMTDDSVDQTSVIVPQVLCDNVKGIQKISEMAEILYWDYYQDPDTRLINLRNHTLYPTYSKTLEVGVNVTESPKYNDNIVQSINEIEIQGVRAYPTTINNFTGDGSITTFNLTKFPVETYCKLTVNGVLKVGSVEGSSTTGTYDYLINKNKGIITFVTPPTGDIIVEYTYSEITSVVVNDAESIALYGKRKLVIVRDDAADIDDATERGRALLTEYKQSFESFTLPVYNIPDITPRYKINFNDPLKDRAYSGLMIQNIKYSWPSVTTEITVGKNTFTMDNIIMSVEERVRKLERIKREAILLTINKFFNNDFYFVFDDLEIIQEEVSSGTQTTLVKRRYNWSEYSELATGTYTNNINIYEGKIELM